MTTLKSRRGQPASIAPSIPPAAAAAKQVPPLENGDHLTRPEFERRYEAMPHLKKAELIEGVVYVGSPVNHAKHARPHLRLARWAATYADSTPGVDAGDNPTLRLDLDNEPQPDLLLRLETAAGGACRLGDDGYLEGPPELVVEVAASSASYDLHSKRRAYQRNGVAEYVVWRVLDGVIDWFVLQDGEYRRQEADDAGVYRSRVFPGLWLNGTALLAGDMQLVMTTLDKGTKSKAHREFARSLKERLAGPSSS